MAPTRSNATQNVIFAFNDKKLLFCVGISIKQVKIHQQRKYNINFYKYKNRTKE